MSSPVRHPSAEELSHPHAPEEVVERVDLPPTPSVPRRTVVTTGTAIAGVFCVLFVTGLVPRLGRASRLQAEGAPLASGPVKVSTVKPKEVSAARSITLPGSVDPLRETRVYARASGYARRWLVDIGAEVQEGQPLLELDTPELDQELEQARAAQAQAETAVELAKARFELSKVTAARYDKLGPEGVASQQDVEEKRTQLAVDAANVKAAEAAVASQKANVHRLLELKSFARVVAPYAGRITTRNVEVGQLVSAGASGGPALFTLASVDTVRVFVHVPQDYAPTVKVGQKVAVTVREYPGRTFDGTVTHTSGALETSTRTLLVDVELPNPKGELLAGMYAQCKLDLSEPRRVLRLPATAVLQGAAGPRVATVDADHRVRLLPVILGEDRGNEVDVVGGLRGDEDVVTNLPEGEGDGARVEIATPSRTS